MKATKNIFLNICWILLSVRAGAQSPLELVQLKNLRGAIVSYASVTQKDSLVLICFWATSSDESVNELNAINANYEKWKKIVPFKLMAVSVDDGTEANKVRPFVNMNEWKFDVFTDINGDLRKILNSNSVPQTMILKSGKVIFLQSGYSSGSEAYLLEKLRNIAVGKS
jgi:cytochrome c biogenesis protein CcmG, thiol:disulfide interchange protein DsbE